MHRLGFLLLAALACADPLPPVEAIPPIGDLGPVEKPVRLHTGFDFLEGPAADGKGGVYFTDLSHRRIYHSDLKGKLTLVRSRTPRANGLMVRADGWIVACEMDARSVVAISPDGKQRKVLAESHDGKPLNEPNDLVIDRQGGIYFTDPKFGSGRPVPQGTLGVYYIAPKGGITRVLADLPRPNGILLSPDEKTLYVVPSGGPDVIACPVVSPGRLGESRVFCSLAQEKGKRGRGGDGLTVDAKGNLYIATGAGLQVWSAKGELLGIMKLPERPTNATFVGRTLVVAAHKSLYTVRMAVEGHAFHAGRSTMEPR